MNEYERRLQQVAKESCKQDRNIRAPSFNGSGLAAPSPAPGVASIPGHQIESTGNTLSIATVDVFTVMPFKGNQLAVVLIPLGHDLIPETKQAIAREFNFSETIFIHDYSSQSSNGRRIDIFTPKEELPFAGHPVIGAICYICHHLEPETNALSLKCKAGLLKAHYDSKDKMAGVEVPATINIHKESVAARAVLKTQSYLARTSVITLELPVVSLVKGMTFVLINLPTIQPHLEKVEATSTSVDTGSVRLDEGFAPSFVGCYFYAMASLSNERVVRLRTRMLEPSFGEDSATGSAACTLACYLALKDGKVGKTYHYAIEQGVEMGRASEIHVRVSIAQPNVIESVTLAGRAVLVTQGTLHLPERQSLVVDG